MHRCLFVCCVSSMENSQHNGGLLSLWVVRLLDNVHLWCSALISVLHPCVGNAEPCYWLLVCWMLFIWGILSFTGACTLNAWTNYLFLHVSVIFQDMDDSSHAKPFIEMPKSMYPVWGHDPLVVADLLITLSLNLSKFVQRKHRKLVMETVLVGADLLVPLSIDLSQCKQNWEWRWKRCHL